MQSSTLKEMPEIQLCALHDWRLRIQKKRPQSQPLPLPSWFPISPRQKLRIFSFSFFIPLLAGGRPAGAAGASPREGRSAPGAPSGARGPRAAGAAAARVPRAGEGARPAPGPTARRRRRRRRMYLVAGGRGLAGCGHLSVSLLGLLLLLARSGTRALVCLPCDESKCEEPRSCPGSIHVRPPEERELRWSLWAPWSLRPGAALCHPPPAQWRLHHRVRSGRLRRYGCPAARPLPPGGRGTKFA